MSALPTWDQLMLPVLRALLDGEIHPRRNLADALAESLHLTSDQRAELLASGQTRYDNRVGWATSDLSRVRAIERPQRGHYRITELGRRIVAEYPAGITERELRAYALPGDEWWVAKTENSAPKPDAEVSELLDPTEQIESGIARIHADVAADLLTRLHGKEPTFFEDAVVKLLVEMGYGGADGQATVTSSSNDGGIDGIIDQDTLGLSKIYVQAKRYAPDNAVQRPELQAFVGALSGKADGGVFITTGRFSRGATDYASAVPTRIILIDGTRLTSLRVDSSIMRAWVWSLTHQEVRVWSAPAGLVSTGRVGPVDGTFVEPAASGDQDDRDAVQARRQSREGEDPG